MRVKDHGVDPTYDIVSNKPLGDTGVVEKVPTKRPAPKTPHHTVLKTDEGSNQEGISASMDENLTGGLSTPSLSDRQVSWDDQWISQWNMVGATSTN